MRSSARPEHSARAVSFRVLLRVAVDGAFASLALDAELARARLDPRDSRLVTAIVYGTLRELDVVDGIIAGKLARKSKLDDAARAALRASVFQLAFLDRLPAHAVVDEAVKWVRSTRDARVAGFVNAVLRKIVVDAPKLHADGPALGADLEEMLTRSLGADRASRFHRKGATPSLDLRVRHESQRASVMTALASACPRALVRPCTYSPLGIRTARAGDPRLLPGSSEGQFVVQEEGSQLIALLLGVRAGDAVLDVCAGRGGKTTHLAAAAGPAGRVVATDLHEHRLVQIAPEFARLGIKSQFEAFTVDWTVGAGGLGAAFDRVLVDAPCSGLGTLHRRPEIGLRVDVEGIREIAKAQVAILHQAATVVRAGGVLLYAVCSPLDEESRDVVAVLATTGLESFPFDPAETFGIPVEADGSLALGPFLGDDGEGTDGYRVFRFQRVDSVRNQG